MNVLLHPTLTALLLTLLCFNRHFLYSVRLTYNRHPCSPSAVRLNWTWCFLPLFYWCHHQLLCARFSTQYTHVSIQYLLFTQPLLCIVKSNWKPYIIDTNVGTHTWFCNATQHHTHTLLKRVYPIHYLLHILERDGLIHNCECVSCTVSVCTD